ncbi:ATP-binding protein [Pseudomonas syringae]|nr:ATP-binding protein [Pseudomonas syringae]
MKINIRDTCRKKYYKSKSSYSGVCLMTFASSPPPAIRRTFCAIPESGMDDIEAWLVRDHLGFLPSITWDEVSESMRVLIVSEAGAGKTYECKTRQELLWDRGEPAFYLELSELAMASLEDLLTSEEESRLKVWLTSQSDVATFFLDSIDELRLTLKSFKTALNKLSKALSGHLARARIVITTRPIPVDLKLISRYLPLELVPEQDVTPSAEGFAQAVMGKAVESRDADSEVARSDLLVVTLLPLSDLQIRGMAALESVTEIDDFLSAIHARNAQDFARRPQDLIELCVDWKESRRIRTHAEQVHHNVLVKLKPRVEPPELIDLSPEQAYEGASRLALAALLTRKLTIKHNTQSDLKVMSASVAFDPTRVLADWENDKVQVLLERGLFGFANYGRVRFHHRSVVEYLAAARLENRLAQGMSFKAVKRLLFAETAENVPVIRPSMRPVATWLARSHRSIFEEVRNREPELLFLHGDPEVLTLEQRKEALSAFVSRYRNGTWRGIRIPALQASRFASTDLSPLVKKFWESGVENFEVRELLLQLVGAGRMSNCADFVLSAAIDVSLSSDERWAAIETLVQIQDTRVLTIAQSMEKEPKLWTERLIRLALPEFFPNLISSDQLVKLLVAQPADSRDSSGLMRYLCRMIRNVSIEKEAIRRLLELLLEVVEAELTWSEGWPHIKTSRPDLLPLLAITCFRSLSSSATDEVVIRASIVLLSIVSGQHSDDDNSNELRKFFDEAPAVLRERVFWCEDAWRQRLNHQIDPWQRLFPTAHYGSLHLDFNGDHAWMLASLAQTQRRLDERQLVLEALLHALPNRPSEESWVGYVESIKPATGNDPVLLARLEEALMPVIKSAQMVAFEERGLRARRDAELRAEQDRRYWTEFWGLIVENPEQILECNRFEDLWDVMGRTPGQNQASGWNRRFLERHFGRAVTDRIRDNIKVLWRQHPPKLPMNRPRDEVGWHYTSWRIGLAALWAEAEDPLWATKISEDDARIAAHYICVENLSSPAWFNQLVDSWPLIVQDTLGSQLRWELTKTAEPGDQSWVLHALRRSPTSVMQPFISVFQHWIVSFIEPQVDTGEHHAAWERANAVLKILVSLRNEIGPDFLLTTVGDKQRAATTSAFSQLWLSAYLALDHDAAIVEITRILASEAPTPMGAGVVLFANLFGGRWNSLPFDLDFGRFSVDQHVRLLKLAYQHIRATDDARREGTFTPDVRDDAQQARNTLLGSFLRLEGAKAWKAKMALAADPRFSHFQDRLRALAVERAAEEMDKMELTEHEVRLIDTIGDAPPKTRDDMFALMRDRLDDIDDFLLRDTSSRDTWALINLEKLMRREIARCLSDSAYGLYTVDQEAATADEKETDIRMRATSGQQATIELKVAEKGWSGSALFETLRKQLVQKYMAAVTCRSGCLIVTVSSKTTWQHPVTGVLIGIQELRTLLEAEAEAIMEEMAREVRLLVRVIDLRPRLKKENF